MIDIFKRSLGVWGAEWGRVQGALVGGARGSQQGRESAGLGSGAEGMEGRAQEPQGPVSLLDSRQSSAHSLLPGTQQVRNKAQFPQGKKALNGVMLTIRPVFPTFPPKMSLRKHWGPQGARPLRTHQAGPYRAAPCCSAAP